MPRTRVQYPLVALRRAAVGCGVLACAGAVLFLCGERYARRDFTAHFQERHGRIVSADASPPEQYRDGAIRALTLRNDHGIEVAATVKLPAGGSPPFPAIVTLGGLRSGRHAIDYLGDTGSFIILAVDYPFRGAREGLSVWEFVRALPALRRAVLDTPPATMLALDYLCARDDVDRSRIVLAGGSLGALFAPAVAAADDRVTALALLFGAGDLDALVDASLDANIVLRRPASWLLATAVSPVEPLKYLDRVAPRPVLMLNGTDDPRMPEECSRALHDAALEPKTVRWMPVGHVSIRDAEFQRGVRGALLEWLVEIGYVSPADAQTLSLDD